MFADSVRMLAPIIGLAIHVVIQVLGSRYVKRFSLLQSIVVGFFAGLFGIIALDVGIFSLKTDVFLLLLNILTYSALGYCYFHFINLGETARRIRIIREIYDAGEEGLSQQSILERYNARQIVDLRLQRLLSKGQIIEREGRYYIGTPVVLLMAQTLAFLKRVIIGKKMEYE